MQRDTVVAVILAGGVGARVGLGVPKQFLKVAGHPVLHHTLAVFQQSEVIREIIVMSNPDWMDETRLIVERGNFDKVKQVLPGGQTRNETTKAALAHLTDSETVLFHDAVRPLVDTRILVDCAEALRTYSAVDVVIPSADTLVVVDAEGFIEDIPHRAKYRRGQTPQGFRVGVLRDAYEKADLDPNFQATDDCSVVLKYSPGTAIATISGSEYNMKVTEPIDLFLIDKLFQVASTDVDNGPDISTALIGKVLCVFGGTEGIGKAICERARELGAIAESFSRSENSVDVSDATQVAAALNHVKELHGRIDAVVNSAGVLRVGRLDEQPSDEVSEMISTNYVGAVNVARSAFEHLKETAGHLLLFTSSSHTRGRANYSVYSSSKAAIVNLGQALADEWSDSHVKVNVVNPERTSTPMRTKAFGEEDPNTLLTAQEVAETCIAAMCSHMTGQVIDVRVSQRGQTSK